MLGFAVLRANAIESFGEPTFSFEGFCLHGKLAIKQAASDRQKYQRGIGGNFGEG